jgi:hypothetical protein
MQAADDEAEWFLNPAFSGCSGTRRQTEPTLTDCGEVGGGAVATGAALDMAFNLFG